VLNALLTLLSSRQLPAPIHLLGVVLGCALLALVLLVAYVCIFWRVSPSMWANTWCCLRAGLHQLMCSSTWSVCMRPAKHSQQRCAVLCWEAAAADLISGIRTAHIQLFISHWHCRTVVGSCCGAFCGRCTALQLWACLLLHWVYSVGGAPWCGCHGFWVYSA
jgi:hypothetical protein